MNLSYRKLQSGTILGMCNYENFYLVEIDDI